MHYGTAKLEQIYNLETQTQFDKVYYAVSMKINRISVNILNTLVQLIQNKWFHFHVVCR